MQFWLLIFMSVVFASCENSSPGGVDQFLDVKKGAVEFSGLDIEPNPFGFGVVVINAEQTNTFKVTNNSDSPLLMNDLSWTGANVEEFSLADNTCIVGMELGVQSSCSLSITHMPTSVGNKVAQVTFQTKAVGTDAVGSTVLGLVSEVISAERVGNSAIVFTPPVLDFGNQIVGENATKKFITIKNISEYKLLFKSVAPATTTNFAITANQCSQLAPNQSCNIEVAFKPIVSGDLTTPFDAKYSVSDLGTETYTASTSLKGRGVSPIVFSGISSITDVTTTSLTLTWPATPDAISFVVFKVLNGNTNYIKSVPNTGGTAVTTTVTGLSPGQSYGWGIKALDVFGTMDANTKIINRTMDALATFATGSITTTEGTLGTLGLAALITDAKNSVPDSCTLLGTSAVNGPVNCVINGTNLECTPGYPHLHVNWSETASVSCLVNSSDVTQTFTINAQYKPCVETTTIITSTGNNNFVVPPECSRVQVKIWGAGGGSGGDSTCPAQSGGAGGAGGYIAGTLSVNSSLGAGLIGETLTATVATGGGEGTDGCWGAGGGGGGASGLLRGATLLSVAAGGGGGSGGSNFAGLDGGAGGRSGQSGDSLVPADAGGGATVFAVGAGGTAVQGDGGAGSVHNGGAGGTGEDAPAVVGGVAGLGVGNGGIGGKGFWSGGGGGGGGYFGGGGGARTNTRGGGGGGGSNYFSIVDVLLANETGVGAVTPNTADSDYVANRGDGAAAGAGSGQSGLVIIRTLEFDGDPPDEPQNFTYASSFYSQTESPPMSWTASDDHNGSGIAYYEIALGTSQGGIDVMPWTNIGNVTSTTLSGLTLTMGSHYYASIRAVDLYGLLSDVVLGNSWYVPIVMQLTANTNNIPLPSFPSTLIYKVWGAGGGGAGSLAGATLGGVGGGAAFVSGSIDLDGSEDIDIYIGQGGGGGVTGSYPSGGGGGGASAIVINNITVVMAGGGGGGGAAGSVPGSAGGIGGEVGGDGANGTGGQGGGGGLTSAAGLGGVGDKGDGTDAIAGAGGVGGSFPGGGGGDQNVLPGGAGGSGIVSGGSGGNGYWAGGGGGGGGLYGGGGGGRGASSGGGGGGGSSLVAAGGSITAGSGFTAGGSGDSHYLNNTGRGGGVASSAHGTAGNNGYVFIEIAPR